MKAKYMRQYDLTLTDREMQLLVESVTFYVHEFAVDGDLEALLAELHEVYAGEIPRPPEEAIPV